MFNGDQIGLEMVNLSEDPARAIQSLLPETELLARFPLPKPP